MTTANISYGSYNDMKIRRPFHIFKEFIEKFRSDAPFKKIVYNTSWLFADRIVRMGIGVLVIIWIARYLGPEQFGIYNYAIAFVALFTALSNLGLDHIVVREIVRQPDKKDEIVGSALLMRLLASFITVVLISVIIFLLRSDDSLTRMMVMIIASAMIFQSFEVIDFWFQSQVQSKYTVLAKNAAFLFISGVHIGLILSGASLIAFAYARLGEMFLFAIGLVFFYRHTGSALRKLRFRLNQARQLLRDSWPLILSGIMIMLYMRIDQVMLGEIIGDTSVGIYSAAIRLTEVWFFIPTAILISVFPNIIETKKKDEGLYYRRLQRLYTTLTWMAIAIALVVMFLADPVIRLLYGQEYQGAGSVLVISIWAGVFVFQGLARSKWLVAENLQKYAYLFTGIGVIINIILNLILIPKYEASGAAIATLITQFTVVIPAPLLLKKTRVSSVMILQSFFFKKS
jgi:polysaccharide transporter, PST family